VIWFWRGLPKYFLQYLIFVFTLWRGASQHIIKKQPPYISIKTIIQDYIPTNVLLFSCNNILFYWTEGIHDKSTLSILGRETFSLVSSPSRLPIHPRNFLPKAYWANVPKIAPRHYGPSSVRFRVPTVMPGWEKEQKNIKFSGAQIEISLSVINSTHGGS
jgi:hypothetical protein